MKSTFYPAFQKKTGIQIQTDTFCCAVIDKLRSMENSNHVIWSAINFVTLTDFLMAEKAGLLQPLDTKIVPVSQLQNGLYDRYGYQVFRGADLVAWLTKSYPKGTPHPTTFEDLFNTTKFPGKRCLYKSPQYSGTLEGALLADGVPANKLYPLDLTRAFKKLDTIKSDIVWATFGQGLQFLLNGTCKMAALINGHAQTAANQGNDISVAWRHALYYFTVNAIPKKSPNAAAAQQFLGEIITDRKAQAQFYPKIAYTIPLKKPNIPAAAAKWVPEGKNIAQGIKEDDAGYYLKNNAAITKAWNNWLVTGKP
jgi:putative spermidine/putrescine transport system substrate-binding protein